MAKHRMNQSITEQSWELLRELRKELGLDKAPEADIEEVVLHERARPPGSSKLRRDTPRESCYRKPVTPQADLAPRPGETQLKHWIIAEAKRSGISESGVWYRLREGHYAIEQRKVNARVVYVRRTGPDPVDESLPKDGEITYRQWVKQQAKELGISEMYVYTKILRGQITPPPRRIVKANLSFVKVDASLPFGESFEKGLI